MDGEVPLVDLATICRRPCAGWIDEWYPTYGHSTLSMDVGTPSMNVDIDNWGATQCVTTNKLLSNMTGFFHATYHHVLDMCEDLDNTKLLSKCTSPTVSSLINDYDISTSSSHLNFLWRLSEYHRSPRYVKSLDPRHGVIRRIAGPCISLPFSITAISQCPHRGLTCRPSL